MKMKIGDNKTKIDDKRKQPADGDKKIEQPPFKIDVEELDKREISMCACTASDDNPYQNNA